MKRKASPVDVLEAAYQLETDDSAWLSNLTRALQPHLDTGHGVFSYHFDVDAPPSEWMRTTSVGMDDTRYQIYVTILQGPHQRPQDWAKAVTAAHAQPPSFAAAIEHARRLGLRLWDLPPIVDGYTKLGIRDAVALRTLEPEPSGVSFMAGRTDEQHIDQRTVRFWSRVAAHIAAGRRLRKALAESRATIEAVLTPSGRVEHAEGESTSRPAREALCEAVLRQDRARARKHRDDPATVVEAWTALVQGRWSLVDRFEEGGRRYVVARRNEVAVGDPRALTAREHVIARLAALGKSNKLIAYELGLSESTIGTHLASAMRKVGATSRVALIRMLAA